jgi:Dolichyl-phosphate-mannose-protein mannosyltransferase
MPIGFVQRLVWDHRAATLLLLLWAFACAGLALRSERRAAWLVFGAALLAGLGPACDPFVHAWDERFHALVASSSWSHPLRPVLWERPVWPVELGWGHQHVWMHKPPLAPWLLGLGRALSGGAELGLRLPSLLLHAAAAAACVRAGPLLWKERGAAAGRAAGALYAITFPLLAVAAGRAPTDHPDSLLLSLTALAGLCALHAASAQTARARIGWSAGCGLLTGAAVLAKSFPGLLGLGVLAAAVALTPPAACAEGRRVGRAASLAAFALACACCAALCGPWLAWSSAAFPAESASETAYSLQHFTTVLEGHGGGPLFHLARLPVQLGWLSPLGLAWLVWRREAPALLPALLFWIGAPYLAFAIAATKLESHTLLAAFPLCLLLGRAAAGLWEERRLPARALAVALLLLPAVNTFDRQGPLRRDLASAQRAEGYRRLSLQLGPGPGLVAPVEDPVEAAYYTNWTALDHPPLPDELARARELGLRVTLLPERR